MSKKKINDILTEFCQSFNCPKIELNQDNTCALTYENKLDITLALTSNGESLNLLIPIYPLSGDQNTDYSTLKRLMVACFPGSRLNGASLSISPYEDAIILTYLCSCEVLDTSTFYNIFTNTCNLAKALINITDDKEKQIKTIERNDQPFHIQSLLKARV